MSTDNTQAVNLRLLTPEDRQGMKQKMVDLIRATEGGITTKEISTTLNLKYSQVYLPLRRVNLVTEARDEKGNLRWIPSGLEGEVPVRKARKVKEVTEKAPELKQAAKAKAPAKAKKAPAAKVKSKAVRGPNGRFLKKAQ